MCKRKGEGTRCLTTPQSHQYELYRQKVKYQARKAESTPKEWLATKDGEEFAKSNNPRILNPKWKQEHQENLLILKENHCEINSESSTDSSKGFISKITAKLKSKLGDKTPAVPKQLSIIQSSFPQQGELRNNPDNPRDKLSLMELDDYMTTTSETNPSTIQNMSLQEQSVLEDYTEEGYESVNKYLRYRGDNPEATSKDYYKTFIKKSDGYNEASLMRARNLEKSSLSMTTHLDNILSERRNLEEPEILYRSIQSDTPLGELQESYQKNGIIKFDGYSSTSHSFEHSSRFLSLSNHQKKEDGSVVLTPYLKDKDKTNVVFEIQTNAGACVSEYSSYPEEKEVLLPRGIHFKIVNSYTPTSKDPYTFHVDHYGQKKFINIEESTLIVQIAECDQDGNILSFNTKEPIKPPNLEKIAKAS